ncbi:GntR family transcriptional regulator [Vibrio superstes NBRC 103154]|uniref:GntR family transcriptional regulator n=2 Tax=Vibrio superstes TaxID=198815 RepID=A0A511QYL7_9VIBR|nr:GntR family transcriptional regulator [Vibrio superstes NBRC 103154]
MEHKLLPGDRLPSEVEMIEYFDASKSTVRESMRMLEAQGLIATKTGPKGGAFVNEVPESRINVILSNYLFFKETSIKDLYQMRIALEPALVEDLAGTLSKEQLANLRQQIQKYALPPEDTEQERQHHIESLEFHRMLADYSNNELLKLVIRFTAQMLSDLTIYKRLYQPKNYQLWKNGLDSHLELLSALQVGNGEKAGLIMKRHMQSAMEFMEQQEVQMTRRFMQES